MSSSKKRINDLKDLTVWQVAMDFAEATYRATRRFPESERYGLQSQLRRAAVSVAANIAEGHGRVSRREYARFALIARGSLKEAETEIRLSKRLDFLDAKASTELLAFVDRISRLLWGLHRSLTASKDERR